MLGANAITQDRLTNEELNQCHEFALKVGDNVIHRGEKCEVTAINPIEFTMFSDMPKESDWWRARENICIGFYIIGEYK